VARAAFSGSVENFVASEKTEAPNLIEEGRFANFAVTTMSQHGV
jgi:hypothetical protein